MNPEIDIGKLALSIMEHPELIEKIKKLGENSNGIEAKAESLSEEGKNGSHKKSSGHRSALLCSLKPYLNEKRRGAIDAMITVFDVLDAVIYK